MSCHRRLFVPGHAYSRAIQWANPATLALLGGLALVLFGFLPGPPYRLDQYDLPKDAALGAIGLTCALQLLARRPPWWEDRISVTLMAFWCWGAIAAPVLATNDVLAWRTPGTLGAAASIFLLARRAGFLGDASKMYWGVVALVCIMYVLVLLEAYGAIPFLSAPGRRPGATLGNRNFVARLACLVLPVLWSRLFVEDRRRQRYILLTIVAASAAVIVLSRSRGSFLVACGLTLFLPMATRWRDPTTARLPWRVVTAMWTAAVLIGGTAVVVVPNKLGWRAADFANSASRVAEYQTGPDAAALFRRRPHER